MNNLNINLDDIDIKINNIKKNIDNKFKDFENIQYEKLTLIDKKFVDNYNERS